MELDLNQEPLDQTHASVVQFDSVMDELESGGEGHIQNRIRHLEAVTSRARQRQRWPPVHSPIRITNFTAEATPPAGAQGEEGREQQDVEGGTVESGKGDRMKGGVHLLAKALGLEVPEAGTEGMNTGNFYDCNICLDMAREPVLTCCGHLFCWPCFYQLSYAYSKAKECPVCKGEVTETGLIPIYGNASAGGDCRLALEEAGLRVPPRPQAPRIESVRQKLINQGASSASVVQNLRRFNNLISGLGEQAQTRSPNTTTGRNNVLPTQSRRQTGNNRRTGSRPVTRLMAQEASSFSSLSSALNSAMDSAERLVQDLESYIHDENTGGSRQSDRHAANRNSTSSVAATNRSESLAQDVAATNSAAAAAAAASVSPISNNVETVAVIGSEIQTTDSNVQILDPSSSNSRRRNRVSRQVSNEPRRRRRRLR